MKQPELHKIVKNVPLPTGAGNRGKYKWKEMEVGDSFVTTSSVAAVTSSARSFGLHCQPPRKFTVRKEGELTRVWRLS